MTPKGHWYVKVEKTKFLTLMEDEGFLELMRLMRALNSLRFAQNALATHRTTEEALGEVPRDDRETPSKKRVRNNAFLYMAAIIHEAVSRGHTLGKYFRNLEAFPKFNAVVNKIRSDQPLPKILKNARNRLAFHFDAEQLRSGIRAIESDQFVLVHGYKKTQGECYYELADVAALSFLVELHDYEDLEKRLKDVIGPATSVMIEFIEAAEVLIAQAMTSHGLVLEVENG